MENELTKKAINMLLQGATLVSEPCPYCKGVRVIKDGNALCINCGRTPEKNNQDEPKTANSEDTSTVIQTLERKIESLSKELENEKDHQKQQEIVKSINSIVETINKFKK